MCERNRSWTTHIPQNHENPMEEAWLVSFQRSITQCSSRQQQRRQMHPFIHSSEKVRKYATLSLTLQSSLTRTLGVLMKRKGERERREGRGLCLRSHSTLWFNAEPLQGLSITDKVGNATLGRSNKRSGELRVRQIG